MPLETSHPPMSHSPAYYHGRIYGPVTSSGQQPLAAHLYQQRRSLSPVAASPASRQSSESGPLSKPAGAFELRPAEVRKNSPQPTSSHTFSLSSNAEEGSVEHGRNRSVKCHSGTYDTAAGQRLPWPDHNAAEYNTTIYTYAPEGGVVERVIDHAVLVLVDQTCDTVITRSADLPYSSGLHAVIHSTRSSAPFTLYSL
jgi:hypothetical protein